MEKCQVAGVKDEEMSNVVGGGDVKFVATAVGATLTCTAGAAHIVSFIAAMVSKHHKAELYKAAVACAAISLTGLVSTTAISKVSCF